MSFEGQVALITGGGGGIGTALADMLRDQGADVWQADRGFDDPSPRQRQLDIRKYAEVADLVAHAVSTSGRIDLLVNCAGVVSKAPFIAMDPASWDEHIAVHLSGTFYACRAVAQGMVRQRYGRILNFASIGGLAGPVDAAHYGAAKAGVIGLTRAMATELSVHGVTVNALAPGPVMTPLLRDAWPPAELAVRHELVPARRLGEVAEIMHASLFLLSREAGYISGTTLTIDGGSTAAGAYMTELYRRRHGEPAPQPAAVNSAARQPPLEGSTA